MSVDPSTNPGSNSVGSPATSAGLESTPVVAREDWDEQNDPISTVLYWLPGSSIDAETGQVRQHDPTPYLPPASPLAMPFVHRLAYSFGSGDGNANNDDNYDATTDDCGGNGDACRDLAVKYRVRAEVRGFQFQSPVVGSYIPPKPNPPPPDGLGWFGPFIKWVTPGVPPGLPSPLQIYPLEELSAGVFYNNVIGLEQQVGTVRGLYTVSYVREVFVERLCLKAKPDGTAGTEPRPLPGNVNAVAPDGKCGEYSFIQGGFPGADTSIQCEREISGPPGSPRIGEKFSDYPAPNGGDPCFNPKDDPCGRFKFKAEDDDGVPDENEADDPGGGGGGGGSGGGDDACTEDDPVDADTGAKTGCGKGQTELEDK